jgi:hypothetical protein
LRVLQAPVAHLEYDACGLELRESRHWLHEA